MAKKTYGEIAGELYDMFEHREFEECKECHHAKDSVYCFKDEVMGFGGKEKHEHYEKVSDLLMESQISIKYSYEFASDSFCAIHDTDPDTEDELDEVEPREECYTHEYAAFIGDGNWDYLEDAAGEFVPEDGSWQLMGQAYRYAQEEMMRSCIELVKEIYDAQEDEEEEEDTGL